MVSPDTKDSSITCHCLRSVRGIIIGAIMGLGGCAPTFNWAFKAGSNSGAWLSDEGRSIATDTAGNVYVIGTFFYTVDFDPGPGVVNLVAGGGGMSAFIAKYYARGLTFGGPAGDLYVTSGHDVLRFNRITGALVTSWNLATDPFAQTHFDLKFGPGGDLYVTAFETNKVLRFNGTTGAPMTDLVSAGSGGLSRPIGLGFGPDGNLYISSSGTSQIIRYNGTTGAFIDVYASGGGLTAPSYLVFGR